METHPVQIRDVTLEKAGKRFEGRVFTGGGQGVIAAIGRETGQDGAAVLETIIKRLLVQKGVDWTHTILSEYLGLYADSMVTFCLVWDKEAGRLAAHAAMFQSARHPAAGLLAHVRTVDEHKGLGLGTLVTEEVTREAFAHGAQVVILATDDKLHRIRQGETAAHAMYLKIGYAILAEKTLADTVDWLMVIDAPGLERCGRIKRENGGRFPAEIPEEVRVPQSVLIEQVRARFGQRLADGRIEPVSDGDLANLFLLLNLCPEVDFQLKLSAWGVQLGPEFERSYVVSVRPGIVDRDRLEDATMVLRDGRGAILAICAARICVPFTRHTMDVDFYCLPGFLKANRQAVAALVQATLERIRKSAERPSPCRILFSGVDREKIELFQELGFKPTNGICPYFGPEGKVVFEARDFERTAG